MTIQRLFSMCLVSIFFCLSVPMQAQMVFLRVDTKRASKPKRLGAGAILEIQTQEQGDFIKIKVDSLDARTQRIFFGQSYIALDDLTALRIIKPNPRRQIPNTLVTTLGTFGGVWTIYTAVGFIVQSPVVGPVTLAVGVGTLAVTGVIYLTRKVWRKTYRFKAGKRPRIIDVRMQP